MHSDSVHPCLRRRISTDKYLRQREQAEEGQYIRKKELEKLKQAQDKVKAAQSELVSLS